MGVTYGQIMKNIANYPMIFEYGFNGTKIKHFDEIL